MAVKLFALSALLCTLTACGESQRSLPVIQAAVLASQNTAQTRNEARSPRQLFSRQLESPSDLLEKKVPKQLCSPFIFKRPRSQRADAVQARLQQADRMTAAFDEELLTVDLIGDHANILSLEIPVAGAAEPSYVNRVSAVVEDYFSSADVQDYLCNSGFAEVRLSARGLDDGKLKPVWNAQVTSEGLIKKAR